MFTYEQYRWDAEVLRSVGNVDCAAAADIIALAENGTIDLGLYPDLVAFIVATFDNYEDEISELEYADEDEEGW